MLASGVWGTVPQWLALGAAVVAVLSYASSRRDAARQGAARVFPVLISHLYSVEAQGASLVVHAVIRNASDTPIVDAFIAVLDPGRRPTLWRSLKRRSAWWTGKVLGSASYWTILPGTEGEALEWEGTCAHPAGFWARPPVLTTFTDANGRQWVRWPSGRINRVHHWMAFRGRKRSRRKQGVR